MDSNFSTPLKGVKSAPAKVHAAKAEPLSNCSSRKCLFPDPSHRKNEDDDSGNEHSTSIETYLKPSNFYGSSAPAFNVKSNAIRPTEESNNRPDSNYKSRVRLFHDGSSVKRTSHSRPSVRRYSHKRPKTEIHTGVSHSIKPRKPVIAKKRSLGKGSPNSDAETVQKSPKTPSNKQLDSPDDKIFFDSVVYTARKTPRSKKKSTPKATYPWLKFTKSDRHERSGGSGSGQKRKFFKSIGNSSPSDSPSYRVILPENGPKRRKLLDLEQDSAAIFKKLGSASDILDLIEDGRVLDEDDEKREENVSRLIGQLEDENEENQPIQNSPSTNIIDITENTGNLSLIDSPSSILKTPTKSLGVSPLRRSPRKRTPTKLFSIFDKNSPKLTDIMNICPPKSSNKRDLKRSPAKIVHRPLGDDQYQIDAGQKRFGEKQCPTCELVYQLGDPDDEIEHQKYHNNSVLFKFLGWQNERVVGRYGSDRVIMVYTSDPKSWCDRVRGLLNVIDKELGYSTEKVNLEMKFLMYVSNKKIAGCLAAVPANKAYKMLMSDSEIDMCSEESYPVKCAVSRIWTQSFMRRTGVATKLMDCLRHCFNPLERLEIEDIAFSVPTVDGRTFAKKYTKRDDYLIHTGW